MATDKTRYKDVKVRIPEEELAVLNCRVAKTGMSREQYIRCLVIKVPLNHKIVLEYKS